MDSTTLKLERQAQNEPANAAVQVRLFQHYRRLDLKRLCPMAEHWGHFLIQKPWTIRGSLEWLKAQYGGLQWVLGPLCTIVYHPNRIARRRALQVFQSCDVKAHSDILVEAFKDQDHPTRLAAFQLLKVQGQLSAAVLRPYLRSSNPDVRQAALRVLGHSQDPEALPYLCRGLEDLGYGVRHAAQEAFVNYGALGEGAVELLVETYLIGNGSSRIIDALAAIGSDQAFEGLKSIRENANGIYLNTGHLFEALSQFGSKAVEFIPAILDVSTWHGSNWILPVVRRICPETAAEQVLERVALGTLTLTDSDAAVQENYRSMQTRELLLGLRDHVSPALQEDIDERLGLNYDNTESEA